MSQVDNERPPYVTFERIPVEDRTASLAEGRYVAKDVDFVTITRPGSRDNVVKEAEAYAKELRKRADDGLIPQTWPEMYEAAYRRWKEGEELPAFGTPIKGWAIISPAAQQEIVRAGIRTVEDLAAANESTVIHLGLGGPGYREKAKAWLASAKSVGAVAEELNSLRHELEAAKATIEQLKEANQRLLQEQGQKKAPAEVF